MADIRRLSISIPAAGGGGDGGGKGGGDEGQPMIPAIPNSPNRRAWHSANGRDVARYWVTSLDAGLDGTEADKRLERLGPNKLTEKPPPSLFSRLVAQVSDFTVLALVG